MLHYIDTNRLYYKHFTIVNDDSGIINKGWVSLTDDTKLIIYDCNMFIIQATQGPVSSSFLGLLSIPYRGKLVCLTLLVSSP
jgi:hypothetical protein